GTGRALERGRRGDADVLLAHDPAAEQQFMADGHGELRQPVCHNDFVVVGPANDPAQIQGTPSVAEALRRISGKGTAFISRGDESGTHKKELALWKEANVAPDGDWYIRAGAGMGQVLRMAGEQRASAL